MKEIYKNKIIEFYKNSKRLPTYSEIMKMLSFKSKNAVYKLINQLVKEGVLEKDSRGKISPAKLYGEVKVLGTVEAGFPGVAEELASDTLSLDEFLIENKEATYMLTVKGDSMIDAGIHEGDLVLVERKGEPRDGDIVIAEIDGGWTMKYFRRRNDKVYLEPANKKFSLIFPKEELKIAAIVKAIIRKY